MVILHIGFALGLLDVIKAANYCLDAGPSSDQDTTVGPLSITGDSGSGFSPTSKYCGTGINDLYNSHAVELVAGEQYSLSWGGVSCSENQYYKIGRAWIDYPGGGWLPLESYNTQALGPVITAFESFEEQTNFVVPSTAKAGFTRARVMVIEDSEESHLQPCHTYSFGGTTDFKVELITTSGGGSSGSVGGTSVGTIFLILLIVFVFVYFAGGFAFNYKKKDKRGIEAVPNIEFWRAFPGYVKDGCMFTQAKIKGLRKGKSEGYSTFEDV